MEQSLSELPIGQEAVPPNGTQEAREYVKTESASDLRALISNISDVIEEYVDIPEWRTKDGEIVQLLVRSLTAEERAQFIQNMQKVNFDLTKLYPDLVILSARHPQTKDLVFKPADRGMLNTKIGRSLERIAMKAADISGLSENFLNDAKKN